jgi:tRNA(Ile)-lysidine synthase
MPGALTQAAVPVSADEFAQLVKKFFPLADKIAVAVSGGPDSMAMALCVKRWAQHDMVALIVDHGLRAESAAEAEQVKAHLQKTGVAAEILRWDHPPVTARLHERARAARYGLLTGACRRLGAGDLLLAHHRDDQAETILMRMARGSGIDGLAGMAAQTQRDGIRLLRPFLPIAKQRLVATCDAARLDYVTDASNTSEKFARGRLRKILPLLADEGLTVETVTGLGARAADARDALDFYTHQFLRESVSVEIGGTLRMERAALRDVPRAVGLRAVASCLRYIHDEAHPPEHESLSALFDVICEQTTDTVRTLYGCMISISETRVQFLREPSAAMARIALRPGETVLWDERWLLTARMEREDLVLGALGIPTHEDIDRLAPGLRHKIPQGRVRASLPALWLGDKLYAIPVFDEKAAFCLSYLKQSFP